MGSVNILYITTCLINGKCYIGVHSQDNPFMFDGYLGSGDLLKKAIKKYGRKNFTRETLFYFWSKEEAYAKEAEIVTEKFINENWNYNMTIGGQIPPSMNGRSFPHPKESNRQTSLKMKGRPAHNKGKKQPRNFKSPESRLKAIQNLTSYKRAAWVV